jgi:hypothetical protein
MSSVLKVKDFQEGHQTSACACCRPHAWFINSFSRNYITALQKKSSLENKVSQHASPYTSHALNLFVSDPITFNVLFSSALNYIQSCSCGNDLVHKNKTVCKVQGDYKWCERLNKFIGKKVIAARKLWKSFFHTLCKFNMCSICCPAHIKTIFDLVPNILQ